jgi:hypothetical protein
VSKLFAADKLLANSKVLSMVWTIKRRQQPWHHPFVGLMNQGRSASASTNNERIPAADTVFPRQIVVRKYRQSLKKLLN